MEVMTVFVLSPAEYEAIVGELEAKDRVRRVPAGNDYFLEPSTAASCDMESGTCSL